MFLLAAVPAGCIFSPHQGPAGGDPPAEYPKLINPTSVLDALSQAYGRKDSTEIKLIYDVNYQGTSFDPDSLTQLAFTKQDEIRHVEALYRSTTITSVSLVFPGGRVRYTDSSDPPGWATISVQNMSIDISDYPYSYSLRPSESWEFKFIPTVDATSPTDSTWKIVRWTELP